MYAWALRSAFSHLYVIDRSLQCLQETSHSAPNKPQAPPLPGVNKPRGDASNSNAECNDMCARDATAFETTSPKPYENFRASRAGLRDVEGNCTSRTLTVAALQALKFEITNLEFQWRDGSTGVASDSCYQKGLLKKQCPSETTESLEVDCPKYAEAVC